MEYLRFAGVAMILTVLPGAWFSFGIPLSALGWWTRLALAVALSPAVLGVQLLLMKLLKLGFAQAALAILLINLPSLLLVVRPLLPLRRPRLPRTAVLPTFLFVLFAGALVLPWTIIPHYRTFSWHALLHTDIIYKLAQNRVLPEEPEVAGLQLAYPWIGHAYWAILGWLTDFAPTRIYPVSNLIWLAAACLLAYQVARRGLNLRPAASAFNVGLMFMATQIIAYTGQIIVGDSRHWVDIFGYRFGPLLEKYRGFETMPFGFALLIGLLLLVLLSFREKIKYFQLLIGLLLAALGLIYPILFPMGAIIVGLQFLLLLVHWSPEAPHYAPKELLGLGAAIATAFVLFGGAYLVFTQDTAGALPIATAGRKAKTVQAVTPLLILLALAAPAAIRGFRQRHAASILLAVTAACLMALSVIMDLGGNEYKYIYVASIVLAPLGATSVSGLFSRSPRLGWGLAAALPVLFIGIDLAWILGLGGFMPPSLVNAPNIDESHFYIALKPSEKDAAWVQSIREATPDDTVLLADDSSVHLGPFVRRSLFAPSDGQGEAVAGYSVKNLPQLILQRRYPEQLLDQREVILQDEVFGARDSSGMAQAVRELQALNRPVAIHFSSQSMPGLRWLRERKLGSELFSNGADVVWYIDRPVLIASQ